MLEVAEKEGKIKPGVSHIFEATAGNTGTALALVASRRGYKLTVVVPDKVGLFLCFVLLLFWGRRARTRTLDERRAAPP